MYKNIQIGKKTNKTNDKKGEINSPLNKNAGIPPNKRQNTNNPNKHKIKVRISYFQK